MIANNAVDVGQSANSTPNSDSEKAAEAGGVDRVVKVGQNGESPCISVCVMDEENGFCQGCWRSISEIAAWSQLSVTARAGVNAQLPSRAALWPNLAGISGN